MVVLQGRGPPAATKTHSRKGPGETARTRDCERTYHHSDDYFEFIDENGGGPGFRLRKRPAL
jgi:hypothetical protein